MGPATGSLLNSASNFYTQKRQAIPKPEYFTTEDPFSILSRFDEAKERLKDGLQVLFVEGTYGVGRTFAVEQSFLQPTSPKMQGVETIVTVADPFQDLQST